MVVTKEGFPLPQDPSLPCLPSFSETQRSAALSSLKGYTAVMQEIKFVCITFGSGLSFLVSVVTTSGRDKLLFAVWRKILG